VERVNDSYEGLGMVGGDAPEIWGSGIVRRPHTAEPRAFGS